MSTSPCFKSTFCGRVFIYGEKYSRGHRWTALQSQTVISISVTENLLTFINESTNWKRVHTVVKFSHSASCADIEWNISSHRYQKIFVIEFHNNTLICFTQMPLLLLSYHMIPLTNLDSSQIAAVNMLFIKRSLKHVHYSQLGHKRP